MEYFSAAKAAAQKIFTVIDREPAIDIFSDTGLKPQSSDGEISFRNVNFSYPSRNTVQVMRTSKTNIIFSLSYFVIQSKQRLFNIDLLI